MLKVSHAAQPAIDIDYFLLLICCQFYHIETKTSLALSDKRGFCWWERVDSNHRSEDATDLQSVPFGHSGTLPYLLKSH